MCDQETANACPNESRNAFSFEGEKNKLLVRLSWYVAMETSRLNCRLLFLMVVANR